MSSGVAVDPKIVTAFQVLVKERKYRAAVFKINEDMTAVQLEKTFATEENGGAKADWTAFTKTLPDNDCRYAAYDFKYEHQGALKTKIIFLLWSPEYSKVRSKMIYASSQEGVVQKLEGIQRQLQFTDRDDLVYESISKQLSAHTAGY
jgi:cofilin